MTENAAQHSGRIRSLEVCAGGEGHERFAVYGTDTGMPIAYALAADHPDRVERLVVSEAPLPGISVAAAVPPPGAQPAALAPHLQPVSREVNEALVRGREAIFFEAELDASAGPYRLPDETVAYYIYRLATSPDALRGSFGLYRAFPEIIEQNEQRKNQRLTMPVLAIGGAASSGEGVATTMKLVANDVQGVVLADAAHWVAEQAPEQLVAALTAFLAPYREASYGAVVGANN